MARSVADDATLGAQSLIESFRSINTLQTQLPVSNRQLDEGRKITRRVHRQPDLRNSHAQQSLEFALKPDPLELLPLRDRFKPNDEADGASLESRLLTEKVRDIHQTQTADLDEVADMRGRPSRESAMINAQTHDIVRNQSLATTNQFNHALALTYAGSA